MDPSFSAAMYTSRLPMLNCSLTATPAPCNAWE